MWNLFKKDEERELRSYIKVLTKEIHKEGPLGVCVDFVDFLIEDELFKALKIFNESKLPQPKSKLMWAAILLLEHIKNTPDFVTDKNLEYMKAVAEASFVYASSAINDNELTEILVMPSSQALELIQLRKQPYEAAWNSWLTTDIDINQLATTVLKKF